MTSSDAPEDLRSAMGKITWNDTCPPKRMSPTAALLCLPVSTDGDPSVLTRLLGHFLNVNVIPHRVVAEFDLSSRLHVKVDLAGVSGERFTHLTAKISQDPSVLNSYWHRL